MPHMKRPLAMMSICAMRAASVTGLWFGMQLTPVPSLMFFVRSRAVAMISSGTGMFSQVVAVCSPIHASSNPS